MKHLRTLLKVGATVALFWFVLSRVDLAELASKLTPGQILGALAAGCLIISIQSLIAAVRLKYCVRLLGGKIKMRDSWVACQYGGFFSHTPISFLGGDAMRVWSMMRCGVPVHGAAQSVIIDRALGFIGMMLLVLITVPAYYSVITDSAMWAGFLVLVGVGLGGTVAFLALGFLRLADQRTGFLARIAEYSTVSRHLAARPRDAIKALMLALAMNLLSPLAIWLMALAYGNGITLYIAVVATPLVLLVSMVPISVAGWGVREGAFVVVFGLFGVSSATSLTVSISFGVAFLLAYIPGAVLFLLRRRTGIAHAAAPAEQSGGALRGLER